MSWRRVFRAEQHPSLLVTGETGRVEVEETGPSPTPFSTSPHSEGWTPRPHTALHRVASHSVLGALLLQLVGVCTVGVYTVGIYTVGVYTVGMYTVGGYSGRVHSGRVLHTALWAISELLR